MIARLLESREISPEVRHFSFEVPGDGAMDFIPGQFVSFTEHIEGKEVTRAYSISSPPFENRFDLCLNRVPDGRFSPHLFNLDLGAELDFKGPYGNFVFKDPLPEESILVATGTGIGPFRSMLMAQLPHDSEHRFTLVFGVRHENGILYREQFEQMAREHANFSFLPTLTQPSEGWTGLTGRLQPHVMSRLAKRRDVDVYICGMKEMVDDLRLLLKEEGLERRRIIFEKYD